jgi:hypothetical protein
MSLADPKQIEAMRRKSRATRSTRVATQSHMYAAEGTETDFCI